LSGPVETCAECRFDGAHYNRTDARRSIATMAIRWRWAAAGLDESLLATRPAPDQPSPTEHASLAAGSVVTTTFADAMDRLATLEPGDEELLAVVHRTSHHLALAARAIHALGAGAPRSTGTVVGVFASGGGVPKRPIAEAVVGYRGVEGDSQASREHHGRVWQALCLWSADVVARLREEGHPIALGNAGENVSIAGADWPSLRPGTRIAIGGEVLAEVSAYATPCKKNAAWFVDGDFNRMSHDREPGISRVYASVLRDGVIRPNDPVVVEPD
jgi:MOSC domain-containing protein YiiM